MSDIKFQKLSWMEFYQDCVTLYKKKMKGQKVDLIVSITRGGNIVSRIYSDLLGMVPISSITMSSYKDMKKLGRPIITEEPTSNFKGKTILIVDEVSDTGATFEIAVDFFKNKKIKKIYTLSPYIKPKTTFKPDFWQKNIDAWIVFPYDARETYEGFVKILGSHKHAIQKMEEIGFLKWEIDAVTI